MYVITRRDLSPGDQAAQALHAVLAFAIEYPDIARPWHEDSNYLVVLSIPDEVALIELTAKLGDKPHWLQREPDWDDVATALVIEPDNDFNRHILSCYPLALKEYREVAMV